MSMFVHNCVRFQPLILTVGELGPADCFLHPLQFWQRLSASEMKEHRESSSNRSESSKENLSPSSHSANISSITSTVYLLRCPEDCYSWPRVFFSPKTQEETRPNVSKARGKIKSLKAGGGETTSNQNTAERLTAGPSNTAT